MYNTSSNILPTKANRAALIIKSVVDFCIAMAKNDISLLCFIVSAPSIIVSAPSIIVNAPSIIVRRIDNLKLYHIIYNLKNQYFFKNKVRWKNEVEKPKYNLPLPDV